MTSSDHSSARRTTGPGPATPRTAPNPTGRRMLQRIADLGGDRVGLADVHGTTDGHPNTTRRVLGTLTDNGLLSVATIHSDRPGRPANAWSLTPAGRSALEGTDEANTVVGVIASYLVEVADPGAAHEIGLRWSRAHDDLVDTASPGVGGVIEVLDALGFAPARRETDEGEAVVLRACPLLGPASAHPEVVCQMHRGMVDGMVQRLGTQQGVELLPFAHVDGCEVTINDAAGPDPQTADEPDMP